MSIRTHTIWGKYVYAKQTIIEKKNVIFLLKINIVYRYDVFYIILIYMIFVISENDFYSINLWNFKSGLSKRILF